MFEVWTGFLRNISHTKSFVFEGTLKFTQFLRVFIDKFPTFLFAVILFRVVHANMQPNKLRYRSVPGVCFFYWKSILHKLYLCYLRLGDNRGGVGWIFLSCRIYTMSQTRGDFHFRSEFVIFKENFNNLFNIKWFDFVSSAHRLILDLIIQLRNLDFQIDVWFNQKFH